MARLARWPRTGGLLVYAGLALFGRPVAAHPSSQCICYPGSPDPGASYGPWSGGRMRSRTAWTRCTGHAIFAPEGVNLASGQLILAASVVLAPVTAAAGPVPVLQPARGARPHGRDGVLVYPVSDAGA